jgi:hypothetical protein
MIGVNFRAKCRWLSRKKNDAAIFPIKRPKDRQRKAMPGMKEQFYATKKSYFLSARLYIQIKGCSNRRLVAGHRQIA